MGILYNLCMTMCILYNLCMTKYMKSITLCIKSYTSSHTHTRHTTITWHQSPNSPYTTRVNTLSHVSHMAQITQLTLHLTSYTHSRVTWHNNHMAQITHTHTPWHKSHTTHKLHNMQSQGRNQITQSHTDYIHVAMTTHSF